jgi:glutathione synthase/RimK-type ligase-like ATP-grasp enzyme
MNIVSHSRNPSLHTIDRLAEKASQFRSNLHRGGSGNIVKLNPDELKLAINA